MGTEVARSIIFKPAPMNENDRHQEKRLLLRFHPETTIVPGRLATRHPSASSALYTAGPMTPTPPFE